MILQRAIIEAAAAGGLLQRSEKIQNILLLRSAQSVEVVDHASRLGTIIFAVGIAAVRIYGHQQVASPPIVQEEQPLPDAPKRCGAEVIWPGRALINAVGKIVSHLVQREVGVRVIGLGTQVLKMRRRRSQARRVTEDAPD